MREKLFLSYFGNWLFITSKQNFHIFIYWFKLLAIIRQNIVGRFVSKGLLTTPSTVLPLHLKQTLRPIIWIFTEGEGDGIKSRLPFKLFPTLLVIRQQSKFYFIIYCADFGTKRHASLFVVRIDDLNRLVWFFFSILFGTALGVSKV